MSEYHPQVVKLDRIEKHPNADSLSIAYVLGDYPVIIKTGDFVPGDLAGYIPLDAIVGDIEQFHFLCPDLKEKYVEGIEIKERVIGKKHPVGEVPEKYRRIKAKKIRSVYSQGMLAKLPTTLDKLPEEQKLAITLLRNEMQTPGALEQCNLSWQEGDDITVIFGLTRYLYPEERMELGLDGLVADGFQGNNEVAPKSWSVPKYDLEGLRKYKIHLFNGEEVILTEKLDGCNMAAFHDEERLWVRSRNFFKKPNPDDLWWSAAYRAELPEKLAKFPHLVFFGELYGQVNPFRYDAEVKDHKVTPRIRMFDIFDLKAEKYLDYDDFKSKVLEAGLEIAPELYRGPWLGDEMYSYAEGNTVLGAQSHIREGFVVRPVKERSDKWLSRVILKLKGEGYNLVK